jgi:CO/xanthine dehydrogenase Mo-binding subunit
MEFRRLNCVRTGDTIVTGMVMHPTGLSECLEKTAEAIGWGRKDPPSAPNKRRGKGIALMWKAPAMPPNAGSSAKVDLNEDGTVTVSVGGQEIGQGSFTIAAQMAAAALGVSYKDVRVNGPLDTNTSPYEWQTVASRLTWSMGNAVVAAARDARQQIIDMVAEAWHENPDDLDIVDGNVISYKSEESTPLKNIVIYGIPKPNDQGWMGGPVVGRGNFMPGYVTGLDPETGQGPRAVVHYTTGAQAVEVEVDLDTGRVDVIRGVAAFDVGKAINPDMVRAQMEGGFVQGISTALFESLQLKEGVLQNPSFVDYRIATSSDAPQDIQAIIVEEAQDDGPWGARGIGEHSLVPTVPAIANAIYDAIGLRPGAPPFTPEKIYLLMQEAGLVE